MTQFRKRFFVVLPAGGKMEAVRPVPSRALAHIEQCQRVSLRIDAFPYQKCGLQVGTVAQVDRSPASDGAPGTDSMYRVTVTLAAQTVRMDGKARPIEAGMRLEAAVLDDRRSLFEWLFEPCKPSWSNSAMRRATSRRAPFHGHRTDLATLRGRFSLSLNGANLPR